MEAQTDLPDLPGSRLPSACSQRTSSMALETPLTAPTAASATDMPSGTNRSATMDAVVTVALSQGARLHAWGRSAR